MRKFLYFIPALIMAGLGAAFYLQLGKDASVVPSALIDQPAPEFSLGPIEGHDRPGLASADFAGQVTVVNVFASWCVPCRAEHPLVTELAKRYDIQVTGLNYKDKPDNAMGFLEELGNPYLAMGADNSGRMGLNWGLYGVPETYVIDGQGNILLRHAGPITQRVIDNSIRPAIESARSGS